MTNKGQPRNAPPVFRREQRHEVRYIISVAIAELMSWSFWLIPRQIRDLAADRLGDLFRICTHTYRDNVEANVRQAAGTELSPQDLSQLTRSIFRTSARNFMDLITMPRHRRRWFLRSVHVLNGEWSTIDDAVASGRGVIFLTGHVGCFDFIGQAFWARGYKLTVVTGRTTSRFIFDGVTHLRAAKGANLVEPTPAGVREVIRALRRGECAVILSDRDFFQSGREVTFFGKKTTLPPGIVRIARDTGAIVVPIFTRRERHGHGLEIMPTFTVEKTHDVKADIDRGLTKVVDVLEHGIRASLDQWAMFQRVWPDAPIEPVRVFPVGSPLESELLERVVAVLPERSGTGDRVSIATRLQAGSCRTASSDGNSPADGTDS